MDKFKCLALAEVEEKDDVAHCPDPRGETEKEQSAFPGHFTCNGFETE